MNNIHLRSNTWAFPFVQWHRCSGPLRRGFQRVQSGRKQTWCSRMHQMIPKCYIFAMLMNVHYSLPVTQHSRVILIMSRKRYLYGMVEQTQNISGYIMKCQLVISGWKSRCDDCYVPNKSTPSQPIYLERGPRRSDTAPCDSWVR